MIVEACASGEDAKTECASDLDGLIPWLARNDWLDQFIQFSSAREDRRNERQGGEDGGLSSHGFILLGSTDWQGLGFGNLAGKS